MTTKRKSLTVPLEVKEVDLEARTFTGYAATWDLDLGGDVIVKGAFKRTIAAIMKAKGKVHNLLDSHDYRSIFSVLGSLLEAEETDRGVLGKWQFIPGAYGDQAMGLVQAGNITTMSIGYETVAQKFASLEEQKKGIWRYITELKWLETSLVLFPMNPAATIDLSVVKSLISRAEHITPEEREHLAGINEQLSALLAKGEPIDPSLAGLAPEDPTRLAREQAVRDLHLRSLGVAVV